MDRKVKPAPFAPGTRLKYVGTHESYTYDIDPKTRERKTVPLCVPGMVVTIDHIKEGRQGTLRHLRDSDGPMYWEDTGEPVLDETHDGYSVYYVEAWQSGKKQGRCIHPDRESTKDWEVVAA